MHSAAAWAHDDGASRLVVEVTMPLPSLANSRCHWRKMHRTKRGQDRIVTLALGAHESLGVPAAVTLIRRAPRRLDDDNWVSGAKAIRDAVARWLVGITDHRAQAPDDATAGVTWRYDQTKPEAPKQTVLRIEIDWPESARRPTLPPTPPIRRGRRPGEKYSRWPKTPAGVSQVLAALAKVEALAAEHGYERCVENKPLEFMRARASAERLGAAGKAIATATAAGWATYEARHT